MVFLVGLRSFETGANQPMVIQDVCRETGVKGDLFTNHSTLDSITRSILPKDDSALICSQVYQGVDIDLSKATEDLFDRLVNEYFYEPAEKRITEG